MHANSIIFKPLKLEHCAQLHEWLQLKHVMQFWDDGDRTLQQVIDHYLVDDNTLRYIFYIDGEAAGYFQSYKIMPDSQDVYAKFALADMDHIGIDFFIGNILFLDKGLASTILYYFIRTYCGSNLRIIADPESTNSRALHIYQKYGFTKIGEYMANNKSYSILALDI